MADIFYSLQDLHQKDWFQSLPTEQKELFQQSFILLEDTNYIQKTFYDYSFIVMPAAKAYEGFIKDLLFFLGLITKKRHQGNQFRVGKALNPNLAQEDPNKFEALYDDLARISNSDEVPKKLWQTWKNCRNKVFHYFAKHEKSISLYDAKNRLKQILSTVEYCFVVFDYNPKKIYKLDYSDEKG